MGRTHDLRARNFVFHHGRLEIITDILFKFKLKLKIHTKQTEFRHKFSQKLHHVHKKLQQVHKKLTKPLKIFHQSTFILQTW